MSTNKTLPKKRKRSIREIVVALKKSDGFLQPAATALGMGQRGLAKRIAENPELKEELEIIREALLDECESILMSHIRSGNIPCLLFCLKCKGKSRGYIERGIEEPENLKITIEHVQEDINGNMMTIENPYKRHDRTNQLDG